MRAFIALDFPDHIKEELSRSSALIKSFCRSGNFSLKQNYHLTLAFIGETNEQKKICGIMDDAVFPAVSELRIGGASYFKGHDGDTIIRKAECGKEIKDIRNALTERLKINNIPFDTKPFRPHITVARKAYLNDPDAFDKINLLIEPLSFNVDGISLMRSDRINGKLVYTTVYKKHLN